jgi:predicted regulator of Ras-like GTPase activity (Roadblock/LC7/MglB family)
MAAPGMIITESDHERLVRGLDRLGHDGNARFVFLLDKAGQRIASVGQLDDIDATSLASLAAGNVAATEGVARVVGEEAFTTLFHEGKRDCLHMSLVEDRVILLVVFDERSSLGLVRLRVEQATPELGSIVRDVLDRKEAGGAGPGSGLTPFAEITDEDIDALFT